MISNKNFNNIYIHTHMHVCEWDMHFQVLWIFNEIKIYSLSPMAKNGQPPCHQNIKWQQILWSSPVRWFAMVWPQLNFFSLFFSGIALDQLKLNFVLQLYFCFNSNPYSFYYFLFFNLFLLIYFLNFIP
jgi:hypothetical protein